MLHIVYHKPYTTQREAEAGKEAGGTQARLAHLPRCMLRALLRELSCVCLMRKPKERGARERENERGAVPKLSKTIPV